jgi:hypothetical protein
MSPAGTKEDTRPAFFRPWGAFALGASIPTVETVDYGRSSGRDFPRSSQSLAIGYLLSLSVVSAPRVAKNLDSRLRGNDRVGIGVPPRSSAVSSSLGRSRPGQPFPGESVGIDKFLQQSPT